MTNVSERARTTAPPPIGGDRITFRGSGRTGARLKLSASKMGEQCSREAALRRRMLPRVARRGSTTRGGAVCGPCAPVSSDVRSGPGALKGAVGLSLVGVPCRRIMVGADCPHRAPPEPESPPCRGPTAGMLRRAEKPHTSPCRAAGAPSLMRAGQISPRVQRLAPCV
jgi:hypothetical protein